MWDLEKTVVEGANPGDLVVVAAVAVNNLFKFDESLPKSRSLVSEMKKRPGEVINNLI